MNRKVLFITISIFAIIAICIAGFLFYKNLTKPKAIHIHAGLQVFVDGKQQDFSDVRFMNIEPCKNYDHEENETPLHAQKEKAHLHDNVGDVVHIHRDNATWADLFKNIGYTLDTSKTIEYISNGKKVDDLLNQKIKPYEIVIVLVGKHGDIKQYLSKQVTVAHIKEAESRKESCGL